MEKTTIYLNKDIKRHLLEMVADISKKQGKRAAMSDIIRDALREYFERQEKVKEKVEEDDRHE
jgi:Arc/MetJ-type ribon-helix-helix transcriptional regulator